MRSTRSRRGDSLDDTSVLTDDVCFELEARHRAPVESLNLEV
jgi:hypothetical protein